MLSNPLVISGYPVETVSTMIMNPLVENAPTKPTNPQKL